MTFGKVTMILRKYTYEQVRSVAEVLLDSPYVRNMEIALNTENAYDIIRKISAEYRGRLNIGAGTVQTYDELLKAIDAGAEFVLSPRMMTEKMLQHCRDQGILSVPGAFTPSEIADQIEKGADIIKVFPANELSFGYAKKVCEPLGDLALMAVGGIHRDNVKGALASGYRYVGTAGGLFPKEAILSMDQEKLAENLRLFETALSGD
ncbi:bifunctional 4-hydroxy-2-oxoglutarate aldolase/2-dehydro-3-deoxy-phosphogluconate aldolase [Faecalicatena contorta]|uniref:bifunctional 4-hydroxy-2-oxoglutarate aldolase/2-dehydro-3-deoxy-phosphogluconate aldolase n=1 Tax=Faecalicatena contorta TaxID=39482 RepID=UPI001F42E152|nr:bifunctional 4-hydroxy-2-oxoglutarate aldolase/2-dehydro-3-deoxy-phosphogluconate aldolase [Faecalicatena contorta]MCF2684190.1 bifunctional 4-hydroxy-2-oxoglutarate aldolase/2-dehydro-3-deoxy-phosphogluconate aldolase [Faecalicatena contorta]